LCLIKLKEEREESRAIHIQSRSECLLDRPLLRGFFFSEEIAAEID
jgi:hypothetical protein